MKKRHIQILEGNVSIWEDNNQSPITVSYHAEKDLRVPGGVRFYKKHQDSASGKVVVRTSITKAEYDRHTKNMIREG